jgi:hypothetical protein
MELSEARFRISEPPVAERDAAANETDAACEIRPESDASPLRFVPGCKRERDEMRALQECRRLRLVLFETGSHDPSAWE